MMSKSASNLTSTKWWLLRVSASSGRLSTAWRSSMRCIVSWRADSQWILGQVVMA
jgi:hypothetical protein